MLCVLLGIVAGLLGARVVLTDVDEALPLLHKNCNAAAARAAQRIPTAALDLRVQHYGWGAPPAEPPACTDVGVGAGADTAVKNNVGQGNGTEGTALVDEATCDTVDECSAAHTVGSTTPPLSETSFDVILCSEGIYDSAFHGALFKSLKILCGRGTVVFISYKERALGEDSFVEFITKSSKYHVEEIPCM